MAIVSSRKLVLKTLQDGVYLGINVWNNEGADMIRNKVWEREFDTTGGRTTDTPKRNAASPEFSWI
jgi:hypothetical protein